MKTDTVECLKCAGSVVLALALLFLLWVFTTPARAELPDGLQEFEAEVACSAQICVLPRYQFEAIAAANLKMKDALNEKAKQPPKCATIEVEPKKVDPPKKVLEGEGPKRPI